MHACAAPPSNACTKLLIRPASQLHLLDGASSHRQLHLFRGQFQIAVDVSPTSSCLGAYQARPGQDARMPGCQDAGPLFRGSCLPFSQFSVPTPPVIIICPCPASTCLLACLPLPILNSWVVSDGIALVGPVTNPSRPFPPLASAHTSFAPPALSNCHVCDTLHYAIPTPAAKQSSPKPKQQQQQQQMAGNRRSHAPGRLRLATFQSLLSPMPETAASSIAPIRRSAQSVSLLLFSFETCLGCYRFAARGCLCIN